MGYWSGNYTKDAVNWKSFMDILLRKERKKKDESQVAYKA